MQKLIVALFALGLTTVALPAMAGVGTPGTPVGMECVVAMIDSCSTSGAVFTAGQYVLGASGYFQGVVTLTLSGGNAVRTQTCTGTLVGAFMAPGGCLSTGAFPPAGVPLTLTCTSNGVGAVACVVNGA